MPAIRVMLVGAPPGAPDGVQDYLAHLTKAMRADEGLEVEVASLSPFPGPGELRALRAQAAGCDVVHVQYPMEGWSHSPLPPVLAATLGRRGSRPLLAVTMHEYADLHRLRKLNVAPLLRRAAGAVLSSDLVERGLRGRGGLATAVIPVGSNIDAVAIDWARARRLREAWLGGPDGVVVGFFGSLYRAKRPEVLLDVVERLRAGGTPAVAVYAGSVNPDQADLPKQLREEAARRGLPDPAFTGFLRDAADVRAHLAAFDAAALMYHDGPSLRRGSLLACLEAGTRAVVPAGEGLAEVVASPWGPAVLARRQLVVVEDAEEAAAAIAEDPWKPKRFPPFETNSWAAVAEAHRRFYERLLANMG